MSRPREGAAWVERHFPAHPGAKDHGAGAEAGERMASRAATLRARVLSHLRDVADATADECAEALGESPLAVRPRLSELKVEGLIEKSGKRRANASGLRANAWRARPLERQDELFKEG